MDPPACSLFSDTLGLRGPERSRVLTDAGAMGIMGMDQRKILMNEEVGKE